MARTEEEKKAYRRAFYQANRERLLARQRAYYWKNPERFKEYQRRNWARNREAILESNRAYRAANRDRYNLAKRLKMRGITLEEYDELFRAQGGKCAICGAESSRGRRATLHIDHCHATGRVRGLLCHHCNTLAASAHLEHHLDAVIAYLRGGGQS